MIFHTPESWFSGLISLLRGHCQWTNYSLRASWQFCSHMAMVICPHSIGVKSTGWKLPQPFLFLELRIGFKELCFSHAFASVRPTLLLPSDALFVVFVLLTSACSQTYRGLKLRMSPRRNSNCVRTAPAHDGRNPYQTEKNPYAPFRISSCLAILCIPQSRGWMPVQLV